MCLDTVIVLLDQMEEVLLISFFFSFLSNHMHSHVSYLFDIQMKCVLGFSFVLERNAENKLSF